MWYFCSELLQANVVKKCEECVAIFFKCSALTLDLLAMFCRRLGVSVRDAEETVGRGTHPSKGEQPSHSYFVFFGWPKKQQPELESTAKSIPVQESSVFMADCAVWDFCFSCFFLKQARGLASRPDLVSTGVQTEPISKAQIWLWDFNFCWRWAHLPQDENCW